VPPDAVHEFEYVTPGAVGSGGLPQLIVNLLGDTAPETWN
jgi:hypothetical protein